MVDSLEDSERFLGRAYHGGWLDSRMLLLGKDSL